MKHVSYYVGNPQEKIEEKRAWWFKRTGSGKLLWPGNKYILVKRFFDDMGRPPIKNLSWDRIYTPNEYLISVLKNETSKT
jgi:hypothetical protein